LDGGASQIAQSPASPQTPARPWMSTQVRELWHFSRETQKSEDFWKLAGIQQIEQ
jgi:hypothetical protein